MPHPIPLLLLTSMVVAIIGLIVVSTVMQDAESVAEAQRLARLTPGRIRYGLKQNRWRIAILLGLILFGVWGVWLDFADYQAWPVRDAQFGLFFTKLLTDLGPELAGIAIGVLAIDFFNERRQILQLKEQLIRDLGSLDNGLAIRAARELRAHGGNPPADSWLTDGSLQGAKLEGANLRRANLMGANLQGARLWDANLEQSGLAAADLRGSHLRKANLQGAHLFAADLRGANLYDAKLQGASLSYAKLQDANLSATNLQGADMSNANLQGAQYFSSTRWPDNFDHVGAGATYARILLVGRSEKPQST